MRRNQMMSNAWQFGRRTTLFRNTLTIHRWPMTRLDSFFVDAGFCIARSDWRTYPRAPCRTRYSLRQESQQEVFESCCVCNNDRETQFGTGVAGMTPLDVMWVGLGGGLGSLLRWWTGRVVGEHYHGDFPLGTFLINVSGAFAIGYLSVLFKVDWRDRYGTALNAGVLTGVLGGYTTFSSMQLDAVKLAGKRGRVPAASYLLLSVLVGQLAAALGGTLALAQG
jgi:fluoride exporter